MINYINGALWNTLDLPARGVEIFRSGWVPKSQAAQYAEADIPGMWLCNDVTGALPAMAQRQMLLSGSVKPVCQDGRVVGSRYEDEHAEYILLGGILPEDLTASREAQCESSFERINQALVDEGFTFKDVVRTWFYLDHLLEWYDNFNRIRDAFFEKQKVFGGFVPASTGIGSANVYGAAILAGAIAMRPKVPATTRAMLESPLQCSALDYRSSFSRAAEIVTQEGRLVFISGTASIEPGGKTVHVEDFPKQVDLSMKVVEAILGTRNMTFENKVRAIVYIKRPEDVHAWHVWLSEHKLPFDFAQEIIADVCRDDLLFEIEMDAISRV